MLDYLRKHHLNMTVIQIAKKDLFASNELDWAKRHFSRHLDIIDNTVNGIILLGVDANMISTVLDYILAVLFYIPPGVRVGYHSGQFQGSRSSPVLFRMDAVHPIRVTHKTTNEIGNVRHIAFNILAHIL